MAERPHEPAFSEPEPASLRPRRPVWHRLGASARTDIDPSLPVPQKTYQVVSGDTLSKIAKKFYGDANKYMKIFEANKDQLSDPDKIKAGQTLKIPN